MSWPTIIEDSTKATKAFFESIFVETESKANAAASAAEAASRPAGPIVIRHRETVSIPGTVEATTIPMGIISIKPGETQTAVKTSFKIQSGTKVKFKFRRKNGAGAIEDLEGFTSLEATTTIGSKTPTPLALVDGDELYCVIEVSESGKGLAATLNIDPSV